MLIDVMLGLFISIGMFTLLLMTWGWVSDTHAQRDVANDIMTVMTAYKKYVKDNRSDLIARLNDNTNLELSFADLASYLPGHSGRNKQNQVYHLYLRKRVLLSGGGDENLDENTNDESFALVALVATDAGDRTYTNKFMTAFIPGAASFINKNPDFAASTYNFGGFIVPSLGGENSDVGIGGTPGMLKAGSFSIDLQNEYNLTVASGNLVVGSVILDGNTELTSSEFLHRVEVPGHPEYNSMLANLNMSGNNINNIKGAGFVPQTMEEMTEYCSNISSALEEGESLDDKPFHLFALKDDTVESKKDLGLYMCRNGSVVALHDSDNAIQVKDMLMVSDGESITKPTCSPYTDSEPEIFLTPIALAEKVENTGPITAFQSFARNEGENSWKVTLRMQTVDSRGKEEPWVSPPSNVAMAQAILICRSAKRN